MTQRDRVEQQVLVVDDEPDIRELLVVTLERMQLRCVEAATLADAKTALAAGTFHLCLTDMRLPDGDGLDLVGHIQQHSPQVPVAMITAYGSMEIAITALKVGAFDFLNKPVNIQTLRALVRSALRLSVRGGKAVKGPPAPLLLGDSPAMVQVRATAAKLARSQAPVHLSGESGTGKEVVARQIHSQGPRADKAFVAVNCGGIPRELIDSELFGHVKGSFTGAYSDKPGLFSAADGGTLFLDEIAELPLDMQVKLLRAIQEKCIRPIGATREHPVDVRILSATHANLAANVRAGTFREDLYYRINVLELALPPLRDRRDDILPLARHFLTQLSERLGRATPELEKSARQALSAYSFPGNVRELENILERAVTLCDGGSIAAADLQLGSIERLNPEPETSKPAAGLTIDLARVREQGLEPYLADIERALIQSTLQLTGNNKTAAARELGISFRALRYRLEKLGLD